MHNHTFKEILLQTLGELTIPGIGWDCSFFILNMQRGLPHSLSNLPLSIKSKGWYSLFITIKAFVRKIPVGNQLKIHEGQPLEQQAEGGGSTTGWVFGELTCNENVLNSQRRAHGTHSDILHFILPAELHFRGLIGPGLGVNNPHKGDPWPSFYQGVNLLLYYLDAVDIAELKENELCSTILFLTILKKRTETKYFLKTETQIYKKAIRTSIFPGFFP